MKATGPVFDVFSYHLYAAASKRCASIGEKMQTTAEAALTPEWLSRPEKIDAFYAGLRDRFEPGNPSGSLKPRMQRAEAIRGLRRSWIRFGTWLNMRAWHDGASSVIMHNTLAASDYGLLEHGHV